eukprot:TRINITY_DN3588_c0_g1_i2.p1 TRINITY_DN3588_c0_g1~~TRINITY_DN3588_c0_g1_i2.p1  ORF type:complete len:434 (+),score=40.95 TRINITY_DN3588_c0_g1_i2:66-1304(+)
MHLVPVPRYGPEGAEIEWVDQEQLAAYLHSTPGRSSAGGGSSTQHPEASAVEAADAPEQAQGEGPCPAGLPYLIKQMGPGDYERWVLAAGDSLPVQQQLYWGQPAADPLSSGASQPPPLAAAQNAAHPPRFAPAAVWHRHAPSARAAGAPSGPRHFVATGCAGHAPPPRPGGPQGFWRTPADPAAAARAIGIAAQLAADEAALAPPARPPVQPAGVYLDSLLAERDLGRAVGGGAAAPHPLSRALRPGRFLREDAVGGSAPPRVLVQPYGQTAATLARRRMRGPRAIRDREDGTPVVRGSGAPGGGRAPAALPERTAGAELPPPPRAAVRRRRGDRRRSGRGLRRLEPRAVVAAAGPGRSSSPPRAGDCRCGSGGGGRPGAHPCWLGRAAGRLAAQRFGHFRPLLPVSRSCQ